MVKNDTDESAAVPSKLATDFTHIGERICQQQLLPGKELETIQKVFMDGIHESLFWSKISPVIILRSVSGVKTISLLRWCREVLLESATRAFFGDMLLEIDPNLFESFYKFDATSWKLNYGYPSILSKDMRAAKNVIITALETYFKLPRLERAGASSLINSMETEMRRLAIDDRDIAAIVMPLYRV